MKKMLLALVLVMVLCVPAFATAVTSPDDVITQTNDPSFKNTNTNTNLSNSTAISNSNSKATAINKQGQAQGQMNDWSQTYNNPMQLPGAIPIIPNPIPLIQGGRVGDVTAQVVKFGIPATAYNGEKVKRVLKVVKGCIFGRTRLEDIEIDLIEGFKGVVDKYGSKDFDLNKVRYIVQYKDSTMGAGVGGGGAGSVAGLNNGMTGVTGSLAVLPGYTRSTADPMYIIKFFEVE